MEKTIIPVERHEPVIPLSEKRIAEKRLPHKEIRYCLARRKKQMKPMTSWKTILSLIPLTVPKTIAENVCKENTGICGWRIEPTRHTYKDSKRGIDGTLL
jgi:hypothetical protein